MRPRAILVVVAPVIMQGAVSAAENWKDRLTAQLEQMYVLTKRSMMDTNRITKQGTVLVVSKEGIAADLGSDLRYSITYVSGSEIREQGGAALAIVGGKDTTRAYKKGERVYVTDIKVGDDYVMFLILAVDMSDVAVKGTTKQTRYKGAVSFKLPKATLPSMDASAVKAVVDPVLAVETELAAAPSPTISLGQTLEEVEKILGKPKQVINLGQKVIWIYDSMKVIFVDGKVVDVQ